MMLGAPVRPILDAESFLTRHLHVVCTTTHVDRSTRRHDGKALARCLWHFKEREALPIDVGDPCFHWCREYSPKSCAMFPPKPQPRSRSSRSLLRGSSLQLEGD